VHQNTRYDLGTPAKIGEKASAPRPRGGLFGTA
jgi:hypothetical protein